MGDITHILNAIENGEEKAAEELLPLVYAELRELASRKMADESPGQTLQATVLVREAWVRLTGEQNQKWAGRAHFFAAAAEAMRSILIDKARRNKALRPGSDLDHTDVDLFNLTATAQDDELLVVNDALEKFAARDKQKAELVKLRYFGGLTIEQAAEVLGLSEPIAKRHWAYARAWLFREIQDERARKTKLGLSPGVAE